MGSVISLLSENNWVKREFFPALQTDGREIKKRQQLGMYGIGRRRDLGPPGSISAPSPHPPPILSCSLYTLTLSENQQTHNSPIQTGYENQG